MSTFFILIYIACVYLQPFESPMWQVLRPMLCLGVVTFFFALISAISGRFTFRAPQFYLSLGFVASIAMSLIAHRWLGGALQAVLTIQSSVGVFFIVACGMHTFRALRALAVTLIAVGLVLSVQGVLAFHFGRNEGEMILHEDVIDHGNLTTVKRLRSGSGILNDPNDLAQHFLLTLPFLWLGWRKRDTARNLFVVLLPAAFMLYGVFLTGSRGAVVTLGLMGLIAIGRRVGPVARALLAGAAILAVPLINIAGRSISLQDNSSRGRVELWSAGLQMFRESPIFGAGFGFFTDHVSHTAHNSFVLCFSELGLLGYFFWTSLLIVCVLELRTIIKLPLNDPLHVELRRWAEVVQMSLYAYIGAALFLSRTYVVTLYMLLGMVVVLMEIARRAGTPVFRIRWGGFCSRVLAFDVASVAAVYAFVRVSVR